MVAAAREAGLVAGPLAVTTWTGLGLDIARRARLDLADAALLTGAAQRQFVAELFAQERSDTAYWSASSTVVGRRSFAAELTRGLGALLATPMPRAEVLSVAKEAGVAERWTELADFAERYRVALRGRNLIDVNEVIGLAIDAFDGVAFRERFVEVLVDDAEALRASSAVLLDAIATSGIPVTLAANADGMRGPLVSEPIDHAAVFASQHHAQYTQLATPTVQPSAPLVFCRHPSMEADAVVGALVAAQESGAAWHEMAVVVPRHSLPLARAVVRALRRRDIPVRAGLVEGDAEPVVRRLRVALGARDASEAAADALAAVIEAAMVDFCGDGEVDLVSPNAPLDRALDALVAFNGLARTWIDAHPTAPIGEFLRALTDADAPLLAEHDARDEVGVAVVTVEESRGTALAPSGRARHGRRRVPAGRCSHRLVRHRDHHTIGPAERRGTTTGCAVAEQQRRFAHGRVPRRRDHCSSARRRPGFSSAATSSTSTPKSPVPAWEAPVGARAAAAPRSA